MHAAFLQGEAAVLTLVNGLAVVITQQAVLVGELQERMRKLED